MTDTENSYRKVDIPCQVTDGRLWFGLLGGAIAWVAHLMLAYLIAEFGCVSSFHDYRLGGLSGVAWLILLVSVFNLGLATSAYLVARRSKGRIASAVQASLLEPNDPRVFMSRSGVLTSGLFILIIAVQTIPILFYLREC